MPIKEEVFQLLDQCAKRNQPLPSIRVIRSKIGYGSMTTISNAVKDWKLSKLAIKPFTPENFTKEVKNEVIDAVIGAITPLVNDYVLKLSTNSANREQVIKEEADTIRQLAEDTFAEVENFKLYKDESERLLVKNHELQKEIETLKNQIAGWSQKYSALLDTNKDLEQEILDLKIEREKAKSERDTLQGVIERFSAPEREKST